MLNTDKIKQVYAQEILDSRGNPTLEVTVTTKKGITAQAKVPSGASVGIHEALELRDEDAERYGGKGVLKAINNVNTIINDVLKDQKVDELTYLDQRMIDYFKKIFKKKHQKDISKDSKAILKLKYACERAKRTLSSSTEAVVNVDALYDGIDFYEKINRATFENLCEDLFEKSLKQNLFSKSGLRDLRNAFYKRKISWSRYWLVLSLTNWVDKNKVI